jgi:biopolymer transport protein ExbB
MSNRGRARLFVGLCVFTLAWLIAANPAMAQDAGDAVTDAGPNFVHHFLRSIGWTFGTVFVALSICLVALIVMLALDLRLSVAIPPGFIEKFTDTVNQRKFKEAYDLARADPSFLGKVMTNGMARLQYGLEDARDAAYNSVDSLKSGKDQLINYVAVISSLGPYIGLVGTVYGMILAFMELAKPGATVNANRLADGISHALVVTMVGIGIAVPGLFFTVFFRNRTIRIAKDTENLADDLLTQMYYNSKKSAASVAVAAPAPPSPSGEMPVPAHATS